MTFRDEQGRSLQDYPRPSVAVDVAVLTVVDDSLAVVVVDSPFGAALPGTFLHPGERLHDAATRVLDAKAGITGLRFWQLSMFDDPDRDPRGWVLSLAHGAVARRAALPGTVTLCPVRDGEPTSGLAFDHAAIVRLAVADLRDRYSQSADPDGVLGAEFTLLELRRLYESIFGFDLAKDTFRRTMLSVVEPTGRFSSDAGGRPAQLYRRADDVRLMDRVRGERLGRRG